MHCDVCAVEIPSDSDYATGDTDHQTYYLCEECK